MSYQTANATLSGGLATDLYTGKVYIDHSCRILKVIGSDGATEARTLWQRWHLTLEDASLGAVLGSEYECLKTTLSALVARATCGWRLTLGSTRDHYTREHYAKMQYGSTVAGSCGVFNDRPPCLYTKTISKVPFGISNYHIFFHTLKGKRLESWFWW